MMLAYLFGSRVRGDSNKFSDKDVLLLAKDWDSTKEVSKEFSKKDYDIIFHDLKKATSLLQKGNLFFKHVIDEGKLFIGDTSYSEELLATWEPNNNYDREIELNINLLSTLRHLPKHPSSNIVATDLAIISIRNILIRKLAKQNIYEFSWNNVFTKAVELGFIHKNDLKILFSARNFKNLYRKGLNLYIQGRYLDRLLNILSKITGQNIGVNYINLSTFKKRIKRFDNYSYKHLRYLELLANLYPANDPSEELKRMKLLYKNPNYVSNCIESKCHFTY